MKQGDLIEMGAQVKNLLQLEGRQMMNASFGAFRLVNTYGAFGNVGKERSLESRDLALSRVANSL